MSLFDAIHKHDVEECERLAKLKVDNHSEKSQYWLCPLGLALLYKYYDIAIILRKHGYDDIGADAIVVFVEQNMIAMVRFYFEETDENPNFINKEGNSILYIAVVNQYKEMVKVLLENGANPNFINGEGKSLLHIAVEQENVKIIKLLLKYKADPNIKDVVNDHTPLHQVIQKSEPNSKIIKLLLKYGANPTTNTYNEIGEIFNPFQLAIKRQKNEAIDIIANGIKLQKEKEYLMIFTARELDESSLLHRDYLPPDMFKLIFSQVWERFHRMFGRQYLKN